MDGFLVILCHTMDDLPVRLFAAESEAMSFASALDENPTPAERELFNTDCSTPSCVRIVQFQNGRPIKMTRVKGFDE